VIHSGAKGHIPGEKLQVRTPLLCVAGLLRRGEREVDAVQGDATAQHGKDEHPIMLKKHPRPSFLVENLHPQPGAWVKPTREAASA